MDPARNKDKRIRILCLEDSARDVELINGVLRREDLSFQTSVVDSREQFEKALEDFHPDVILSDHFLPQFNSLAALRMIKEKGFNVPFILVTGSVSEDFAVNCLKHGADDYILKSNLVRLPSAIMGAIQKRQIELKRENVELALRRQNEELVKVNHELDSFVYSVSHNLRAPLLSILGLINLSRRDLNGQQNPLDHYFAKIEMTVLKLDETLKEIIDYSRNARSEVNYSQIDFHELIRQSVDNLKYMNHSADIEVRTRIDDGAPFFSDPDRLKVIMNNLLSNSIKYRDATKTRSYVEIDVLTTAQELQLRFTDNGIGIEPELQPRIFDMFFRATERSDGAGLGLYIVKEAVKKLSGSIDVTSAMGLGTNFFLQLPNGVAPPAENQYAEQSV